MITQEESFLECEAFRYSPQVDPFPIKAPAVERNTFPFKRKHETGDPVVDTLIRIALYSCDRVGDKRRDILRILPVTRGTFKLFGKLSSELSGLRQQMLERIKKVDEIAPGQVVIPEHFHHLPELKKD